MPVIELSLDSSGAVTGLKRYEAAVDSAERKTKSSFEKMTNFAKVGAAAAAAAVVVVGAVAVAIGKSALEASATMEEAQSKYDVVFKGMTDTTNEWVKNLEDNYALSEYAAKEYLSSTKAIIDGTRMQSEQAGVLSNKVVLLAQDLASFHDKAPIDAVNAMTSALTGEYEAMKQFGIVIKKSEVDQRAMIDNNLENKDAITQAMVAQAAYALMLERSGEAVGDTIRSNKTYTFQLKQAEALIMNLKVAIGDHLLPYATQFLTTLNKWIKANEKLIGIKLDEFFDNASQMMKQLGEAAMWTYERMVAFSNALALFEQVGSDQLSWFEYATMNAKEAAEWLDKHKTAVEEDTKAITENKDENVKLKTSLDLVNEATNESTSEFIGYADGVKSVTDKTKDLGKEVKEVIIPVEQQLKEQVDSVVETANASTVALEGQAVAATKVATAVNKIADANQRTSATAEGTYEASKAWSGGTSSMGSSPTLTQAETDYINSRTAQGAAGSVNSKLSSFVTSNDRDRWASMDSLQLSSRADALQDVYAARDANGGAPVTNIMNIFNQNVSSSDVTNIIEEQQRQEART